MEQQIISLQTIWEGMQNIKLEMIAHMDSKLDNINTSLNKIENSMNTLGDHVNDLEQRVSTNEDEIQSLLSIVKKLEKQQVYLAERAEEAENRSRAYNLRFISIPEKAEGDDIRGFMHRLIPQLLGAENFPTPPVIQNCHRNPAFLRENARAGPRPILVRFLYLQDKLKIMKLSRDKKILVHNERRVYIYPDFSAELSEKRKRYNPLKKQLQERGCKYSMVFPSKMKVIHGGKINLFCSPEEVAAFLNDC